MQEECNLMTCRSKSRAHNQHSFFQAVALVSMYPVSSGFENGYIFFVQDSFSQKRETLPGAIVIRVEPTSSM